VGWSRICEDDVAIAIAFPSSLVLFESSYSPAVSCATASWRSCSKLNAGLDANREGTFHEVNSFPDRV
jgi:hypothetical protein